MCNTSKIQIQNSNSKLLERKSFFTQYTDNIKHNKRNYQEKYKE